jgi:hypothetical protein
MRLRKEGVVIIEGVLNWRRALVAADPEGMSLVASASGSSSAAAAAAFAPFLWRGRDYLEKMQHDLDFVSELAAAVSALMRQSFLPAWERCLMCAAASLNAPSLHLSPLPPPSLSLLFFFSPSC